MSPIVVLLVVSSFVGSIGTAVLISASRAAALEDTSALRAILTRK